MRKKITLFLCTLILILVFCVPVYGNDTSTNIQIDVNKNSISIPKNYGMPYIDKQSRTMVPVRFISEYLGHSVEWKPDESAVVIDDNVKMTINSNIVEIGDKKYQMDTVAILKPDENRVYVPVRFVAEALGHFIKYTAPTPATSGYYHYDFNVYIEGTPARPAIIDIYKKIDMTDIKTDGERKKGYNEDGVFIGESRDGKIPENMIGSVYNPAGGKRPAGSTLEEDITNLNKNFPSLTNIKNTPGGYTFQEIRTGTDPFAVFSIGREDGKPVIYIRDWAQNSVEERMEKYVMGLNGVMETLKHYSVSYADGEKIFAFINQHAQTGRNIDTSRQYTFGSTKVTFRSPGQFGIDVIFD